MYEFPLADALSGPDRAHLVRLFAFAPARARGVRQGSRTPLSSPFLRCVNPCCDLPMCQLIRVVRA